MKKTISKKIAWGLAAALCAGAVIPAAVLFRSAAETSGTDGLKGNYAGTFTAFAAEETAEPAADMTYTMTGVVGMFSTDYQYLLLATGVTVGGVQGEDSGLYEVGYTVKKDGADQALDFTDWQTLYTGITFSSGETQTITDVLGASAADVTGMIVYEMEYDPSAAYTIQPYVKTDAETEEAGTEVAVPQATVTVQAPAGLTPSYETQKFGYGSTLTFPTFTGTAEGYGAAVQGWYDVETGKAVTEETVVKGNMTVAPFFNVGKDGITQLKFGTFGDGSNVIVDNFTPTSWTAGNFTVKTDVYDGFVKGTAISGSGSAAISSFRVKTNYQWDNFTVNYADVYFVVTNNGTETVSFDLKMIPGGGNVSQTTKEVAVADLAPGETRAVMIDDFNQTNKSAKNLLTYIEFNGEVTAFDLHVGIAVEKIS